MIWQILMTAYVTVTLMLIVFVVISAPGYLPRVIFTAWLWPITLVQTLYRDWKYDKEARNG